MSKVIVISSGKGGVGKTVTAINLAASINALGKNVVVVDANLTTPHVALHLGAPIVPISLTDVLKGKHKVKHAVYQHNSGTKVVPASISPKKLHGIKLERFGKAIQDLRKISDVVIVDSAAGLNKEVITAIKAAHDVLVITNPEIAAVTEAIKIVNLAEKFNISTSALNEHLRKIERKVFNTLFK